jgi:hypothetical protein
MKGLLIRAVIILVAFGCLHLLNAREYTSMLSGTAPTEAGLSLGQSLWGSAYLVVYLAVTVTAPILILAAGIYFILTRLSRGRTSSESRP